MSPNDPVRVTEWDLENPEDTELGIVYGVEKIFDVVPVLDTNALITGDVMCATVEIPDAFPVAGGQCLLHSMFLLDKSDQGAALETYFLRRNRSMGVPDAVISISDAHAEDIIAVVPFSADDYYDLLNSQVANKSNQKSIGMVLHASPDSTSLWLSLVIRDGGTFAADGIMLKIGLVY